MDTARCWVRTSGGAAITDRLKPPGAQCDNQPAGKTVYLSSSASSEPENSDWRSAELAEVEREALVRGESSLASWIANEAALIAGRVFLVTNVLIVRHFGQKRLLNALNVNVKLDDEKKETS